MKFQNFVIWAMSATFFALPTLGAQSDCGPVSKCAQQAVDAAKQARLSVDEAVPKGAVMAFDLPDCPTGWSKFDKIAGRFPLGAGQGIDNTKTPPSLLTKRNWTSEGSTGGEEAHKLTIPEMPRHNHGGLVGTETGLWNGKGEPSMAIVDRSGDRSIKDAGGDLPHNIMPPFLVLTYCIRQ